MKYVALRGLSVCLLLAGSPVGAKTLTATAATLKTVFASAVSGDRIVLSGTFAGMTLQTRVFSKAVVIDASAATFTNTLRIYNVTGLTILGGHFGSKTATLNAVSVRGGSRITFTSPVVVGNRTSSHGIDFSGTSSVTVSGGTFTGLRSGVSLTSVTKGTLSNNQSLASTSDGFDVAASHNISITGNSCSGTKISTGAHPDCVQLWSIPGQAPTSDITIRGNTATGDTQGFSLFDHNQGGGLRIKMLNNTADITYTQAVACYECVDSVFTGNTISTQPGARWAARMSIIGGTNNRIANNVIAPFVRSAVAPLGGVANAFDDAAADLKQVEAISFKDAVSGAPARDSGTASFGARGVGASAADNGVPEPGTWALLAAGFGLVGTAFRKRRRGIVAA